MKKILTLFVMLLCGWGIVSAQPAFGYQVVVRTADNELVVNTNVGVTIAVLDVDGDTLYSETQSGKQTDDLGMLNLLVGTGTATVGAINDVDWSVATKMTTTITINSENVEVETPIYAVPFALQAGKGTLTTDQIVEYVEDADIDDYKAIMDSLLANEDSDGELWNMIKQRLAEYMKSRKGKAVKIASYYLKNATVADVNAIYNEVKDRKDIMNKVVSLMYNYAIDNRDFAMQLVPAYVSKLDAAEDVAPVLHTVIQKVNTLSETEKEDLENALLPHLVNFAKSHRNLAVRTASYFLANASGTQMQSLLDAFNHSAMLDRFVYHYYFNYLDYYFQAEGLTAKIKAQVDAELQGNGTSANPGYLKREGSTPIDPCAD